MQQLYLWMFLWKVMIFLKKYINFLFSWYMVSWMDASFKLSWQNFGLSVDEGIFVSKAETSKEMLISSQLLLFVRRPAVWAAENTRNNQISWDLFIFSLLCAAFTSLLSTKAWRSGHILCSCPRLSVFPSLHLHLQQHAGLKQKASFVFPRM